MKVLVTGGAGFIGSHLVRQLLADGHEVTVLDDLSAGVREHLPASGFTFWKQDVRHQDIVHQIAFEQFDAIVHLAAQTMVDASIRDPRFDADENVMGLLNVLEAARLSGVKRVLLASTAAAYGDYSGTLVKTRIDKFLNVSGSRHCSIEQQCREVALCWRDVPDG